MNKEREIVKEGKNMISSWERMKAIIKTQYLPSKYEVNMHRRLKNMRQKDIDANNYTNFFHKLSLRSKKKEDEVER